MKIVKKSVLLAVVVLVLGAGQSASALPVVTSGSLVAHFEASPATVGVDANGNVLSWTASNDPAVMLSAFGSDPANIRYSPTAGFSGGPAIVVNDFAPGGVDDNQVLRGTIPGSHAAVTIFWHGFYAPGRDGSLNDGAGQYAYSWGADGVDGSQMDHQTDDGRIELFGGNGTQTGNDISGRESTYTVWHTFYGTDPTGAGHAAFADGTDLGVPSPNGGVYNVSGNLQLFGFQNASGTSDGFNFVGNMSQLIIYDGILDQTDVDAVTQFLTTPAAAVPEPRPLALLAIGLGLLGARAWSRRQAAEPA